MKKLITLLALLSLVAGLAGAQGGGVKIKFTFRGTTFYGTLNESATAKAFVEKLPLTVPMQNLYSREMVYHFPEPLPTDKVATTGYDVGEIIYWPPRHSFVIMYAQNGERFAMQKMGVIQGDVSIFKGLGTTDIRIELEDAE